MFTSFFKSLTLFSDQPWYTINFYVDNYFMLITLGGIITYIAINKACNPKLGLKDTGRNIARVRSRDSEVHQNRTRASCGSSDGGSTASAAAAAEMPAGAAQRVEALPEALLAILGHLVDDPKSLARAGAVGRAWREAAAANGETLWEQASTSIPLLDILQEEYGIQALDSDDGDDDDEDANEGRLSFREIYVEHAARQRVLQQLNLPRQTCFVGMLERVQQHVMDPRDARWSIPSPGLQPVLHQDWRLDLEDAARGGDRETTRRILSKCPVGDALEYVEARGLLAKVAQAATVNEDDGDDDYGMDWGEFGPNEDYRGVCIELLTLGAAVDLSDHPSYATAQHYSGHTGSTPLCWAAANGHSGVLELLLRAGAEVDRRNEGGCTPLFMAACNGHQACCYGLRAFRADCSAMTTDGQEHTPVSIAELGGHTEIARELRYWIKKDAQQEQERILKERRPLDSVTRVE
jgi:hypothetical protein